MNEYFSGTLCFCFKLIMQYMIFQELYIYLVEIFSLQYLNLTLGESSGNIEVKTGPRGPKRRRMLWTGSRLVW
jgi:hypothetical protein